VLALHRQHSKCTLMHVPQQLFCDKTLHSVYAKGLIQPAVKSRCRDYLRIIYSPDNGAPPAKLGTCGKYTKRSSAIREFALGRAR
jgi:hypothetical protein